MAPKRKTADPAPAATTTQSSTAAPAAASTQASSTSTPTPASIKTAARGAQGQALNQMSSDIVTQYVEKTPQQIKLIDAFLAFLVIVGATQFLYCVLAGNYPFNAFLSGFSATVGQFVLTASLRIQTNGSYKQEFSKISPERAFADYIVCSLILHFFCVSYLN